MRNRYMSSQSKLNHEKNEQDNNEAYRDINIDKR